MAPPLPPALPNFWLGTWSRPPDRPSQVALAVAGVLLVVALVPGGPRWLVDTLDVAGVAERRRSRRFLFVSSFVAAFLSLGYVAFYLRGGPRAPESATFWLQGRALLHGQLAWTAPDPSASFRAKNLFVTAPDRLAAIFPPGFAMLLAPAFLLGAPMLIGPLLAAALVPITWLLGRELAIAAGQDETHVESAARVAVGLSLASAALRYHTAESLPHGAAAFALAATLACALRARRLEAPRLFAGAGLALGFLLSTQPPSAVAGTVGVLALALGGPERGRSFAWACAGALPGVALLLAANHAAVGHAFVPPGALYARLVSVEPGTPGAKALALATARLVRSHLTDVDNFEPLALLPLLLLRKTARGANRPALGPGIGLAVAIVAVQLAVLAAAGRHDDAAPAASVEGLLAHVVPIEHALIALALVIAVPPRWSAPAIAATLAFALAGFGVHASHDHARRAAAGWGRPHYEPDIAREAGATHGILFFDDDEGFELAHDPAALPSHGIEAIRMRGDDHDRLAYDLLGHPPTHRYVVSHGAPAVSSWTPSGGDTWRFEAEADFPPVIAPDRSLGQVAAIDAPGTCASDNHALGLTPAGAADASATIELPIPRGSSVPTKRSWMVTPRAFQRGGAGAAELALVAALGAAPLAQWSWSDAAKTPICSELSPKTVELASGQTRLWLVLTARGGPVALDRTTLRAR